MASEKLPLHMSELGVALDESTPPDGQTSGESNTNYAEYISSGKGLSSSAHITPDGRITVSLDLKQKLPDLPENYARNVEEFAVDNSGWGQYPRMNIVVMIVGSRGDVQPYVALGKLLLKDGHRVRIATHETFRSFVNDAGLEFFSIGGDPQDLMSYMVKNPGLMPGMESLMNGDIGRKRKMLTEMMNGCWRSCYCACPQTGRTFVADAIISNPPAFAHVHCAEALGIPLLLSFTMPWSPTASFPQPLVNINQSNAESGLTNYLTYAVADILTWQGIGDIVNKFRTDTLGLSALTLRMGPGLVDRLKIPWTYCMSPALVPKPVDWKNHIDVVGFYFLDLATSYQPPEDLAAFLAAGEAPVYIGFGSVVVEDAAAMTKTIFEATAQAGVRALVSAGWGGLGGESVPSHIFILGNVPHDWLFDNERVSAVVHHGGAGTTAVGLAKGRPTVVVPFFGDQGFWGSMIHRAGAGPEPIPHKKLGVENLRDAITFAISPEAKEAAAKMAEQIRTEDGVRRGVDSFYKHLPLLNMRCDIDPDRVAVWWCMEHYLKLSAFAAQTLIDAKELDMSSLQPHRTKEYDTMKQPTEDVSGGSNAIFWTVTNFYANVAEIFNPIQGAIHTTSAVPRDVVSIAAQVHKGLYNAPKLYGSETRKTGKVNGFRSGVKEAGKGFYYGWHDGITGLVREPYEGAKKDGFLGAIKGSARSFVNVTMRPAAGIVGLVVHPVHGAMKTLQLDPGPAWLGPKTDYKPYSQQRATRESDGVEVVKNSTSAQRAEVMKKFKEAKATVGQRRRKYEEAAERIIAEDAEIVNRDREEANALAMEDDSSRSRPPSKSGSPSNKVDDSTPPPEYGVRTPPPLPPRRAAEDEDDEAAFNRDMELAKQLSLAEQRGYERGLSHQQFT